MTLGPSSYQLAEMRSVFALSELKETHVDPYIDFDFTTGLYWSQGLGAAAFASASGITSQRSSTALARNLAGQYASFATHAPRITDRGLRVEQASTNEIRNNTMVGAVLGEPGTLPTNWSSSAPGGVTREVVAVTSDPALGLTYIDVRFHGVATTNVACAINFDTLNMVVAAAGQTWSGSVITALVAGALPTGVDLTLMNRVANSSNVNLSPETAAQTLTLAVTDVMTRFRCGVAITDANAAFVMTRLATTNVPISAAVDFTLRIAVPQLESGAMMTSPIPTTGAAATRALDNIYQTFGAGLGSPMTIAFTVELDVQQNTTNRYFFQLNNPAGGTADRIRCGRTSSGGLLTSAETTAGGFSLNDTVSGQTGARVFKVAISHDGERWAVALDGTIVETATGPFPPDMTVLSFGRISSTTYLNGWVRRASLWNRALTTAEMEAVTAPDLLKHIVITGQSNGQAYNDDPALTPDPLNPARALMFNVGERLLGTAQNPDDVDSVVNPATLTGFVNLIAEDKGPSSQSIGPTLAARLLAGMPANQQIVIANSAIGGTKHEERCFGQAPFDNAITGVRRMVELAGLRTPFVPYVICIDGEGDRADSIATWLTKKTDDRTAYNTAIKALTKQSQDIIFVTDQMGYPRGVLSEGQTPSLSDMPLAQLKLAIDYPGLFACAGPKYHLPPDDPIHLAGLGQLRRGLEIGDFLDKGFFIPPYIADEAEIIGDTIYAQWVGDYIAPMVIDTDRVKDPGNYGISVRQSTGAPPGVVSVSGVGMDGTFEVKVTGGITGATPRLCYARNVPATFAIGPDAGSRGCFRDSTPDTFTVKGVEYPLHIWGAHCEASIVGG